MNTQGQNIAPRALTYIVFPGSDDAHSWNGTAETVVMLLTRIVLVHVYSSVSPA
jgi:hypothetical protein